VYEYLAISSSREISYREKNGGGVTSYKAGAGRWTGFENEEI
jgi:hypothetical protein